MLNRIACTISIFLLVTMLTSSSLADADLYAHTWYKLPELKKVGAADALNITVPEDAYGKVLKYMAVKTSNAETVEDEVPGKIRLAAVGDVSCNNRSYKRLADAIKQYDPDRVLLLGDYSYRVDDARCFTDVFSFPADKVIAIHGNHDNHYWDSAHRPTYEMMMAIRKAYNIPVSGSYVRYHNIAFIAIDDSLAKSPRGLASIDGYSATYASAGYNLGIAGMDKGIDWRIVMMHISLNKATDALARVRESYAMMLDEAGVDIILSGDTHHYTRTYPLKGINMVVDKDKSSYSFKEGHGRIQYIVGTGGASPSNADYVKGIVAASVGRERLGNTPAYLQIEVTNDAYTTMMRTRLVDIEGNVYDEVSITKVRSVTRVSVEEFYLHVDDGRNVKIDYGDRRFFDGSSGRMAVLKHHDRMNGNGSSSSNNKNELSIALWFLSNTRGSGYDSSKPAVLMVKGNPLARANISFLIGIDSSGAVVYEWDGDDGKRHSMRSDGTNYADGRWHHLALIRDGTSTVMYVDGEPVKSNEEAGAMPVKNSYDVYINAMPDYSYTAKAMVYAPAIWDRALSTEEVLSLYSGNDAVISDAIVYELVDGREDSSDNRGKVFIVNAGESLTIRWYSAYNDGREHATTATVVSVSNGVNMQQWQSLSISRAFMRGAYGSMYNEVVFGIRGL